MHMQFIIFGTIYLRHGKEKLSTFLSFSEKQEGIISSDGETRTDNPADCSAILALQKHKGHWLHMVYVHPGQGRTNSNHPFSLQGQPSFPVILAKGCLPRHPQELHASVNAPLLAPSISRFNSRYSLVSYHHQPVCELS